LLPLKVWHGLEHYDPVRVRRGGQQNPASDLLSKGDPVPPAVPERLVLQVPNVPADQVALLVDPVAHQAVGLELVAVDADPAVVPLVRLVAVVPRASPGSRSGRSVKSLKCGRRRA